jgi:hypothetical protein
VIFLTAKTTGKEIYEILHPETKRPNEGGAFRGNQHTGNVVSAKNAETSFTAATAKATVKAERTIRLAVARELEITENLHRADLTALERDEHIAERLRLKERELQSSQVATNESKRSDGKGHRRPRGA